MSVDLLSRVPPILRALADAVPGGMYLVGGAVRDLLLERPVADWDLAADRPEETARAAGRLAHVRVVQLRADPMLALHVPVRKLGTLDVTRLDPVGPQSDLLRRDFTINAIALDLRSGEILDPVGGRDDLQRALIRVVKDSALADDPTRIVRAYRLAADLGFRIDAPTRELLRRDRETLRSAPPQRYGAELLRLFESESPIGATIALMDADRVLDELVPMWPDLRGIVQGPYHHRDVLGHTLEAADFIDLLVESPPAFLPHAGEDVRQAIAHPHRRASVRAGAMLHDIGKPARRYTDDEGRLWFRGHESTGANMVAELTRTWGWPRRMRKAVSQMVGGHMRVMHLSRDAADSGVPPTDTALRRLLRDEDEAIPGIFLVCIADLLASRGPATEQNPRLGMIASLDEMASRSLRLREEEKFRPRILTGEDLMTAFGLLPGPQIGDLLAAVETAHEDGQVTTRDEALTLARRRLVGQAGED
jgi:putative nucleotidyltransferase with HDIG domain